MGILFYLVFVGAGLSAAFLIQKALKAIKLIWINKSLWITTKIVDLVFNVYQIDDFKGYLNIKNIEIDLKYSAFKSIFH